MTWTDKRAQYVEKLEASVRRLVGVASAWPAVERVVVFGSYARGRRDLLTDLDAVVILRSEEPFLVRQELVYVARGTASEKSDIDLLIVQRGAAPSYYERLEPVLELERALQDGTAFRALLRRRPRPSLSLLVLSETEAEEKSQGIQRGL